MPQVLSSRRLARILVLALSLVSAGCVTLAGAAALRERAQEVFRHHNSVAGQAMLAMADLETEDPIAWERLGRADAAMLEACAPLNEVAVAHREGQSVATNRKRAVPRAIDACEQATALVAGLLKALPRGLQAPQ